MADFADIYGQEAAKRAMIIALAGKHSIVLIGPTGHGKTMLIDAGRALDTCLRAGEARTPALSDVGVDIHVEVPRVPFKSIGRKGTSTYDVLTQLKRAAKYNGQDLDENATRLLQQAYVEFGLSMRSYAAILRVARTIANLEGDVAIQAQHVAEAVQYRLIDRLPEEQPDAGT